MNNMIFPNIKGKNSGYVNLNLEAIEWYTLKNLNINGKNILLDPQKCQYFVNDVHEKYSLDFSYGGWMEDRTFLWRDSYLEEENKFIHLGVDINVPGGTEVAIDYHAEVVKTGNNHDYDGGWGTYVIFKILEKDIYIIYAHLDENIICKTGDILDKGKIFGKVGFPPENGNWFTHVHIQTFISEFYNNIKNWDEVDGYGFKNEVEINKKIYLNPIDFVSLI